MGTGRDGTLPSKFKQKYYDRMKGSLTRRRSQKKQKQENSKIIFSLLASLKISINPMR